MFLGEACLTAVLTEHAGYPGVLPGDGVVAGELFEIPTDGFTALDRYEGFGYVRCLSSVRSGDQTFEAWVYWLDLPAA